MFSFESQQEFGSPYITNLKYEEQLIRILCLPLSTATRQLAVPELPMQDYQNPIFCGEAVSGAEFSALPPVNSVCKKLSSDEPKSMDDNTNHDTYEAPSVSPLSELNDGNVVSL